MGGRTAARRLTCALLATALTATAAPAVAASRHGGRNPTGAAAPGNDDFAGATPLEGDAGEELGTTVGSTLEPGEPDHCGFFPSHSVWYRWRAPAPGRTVFSTMGSVFDTDIALYTGTALDALTLVECSDDYVYPYKYSRMVVDAEPGAEYYVAVAAEEGVPGDLRLRWQTVPWLAPNDDLAGAVTLAGGSGWFFGHNEGATAEPGEPDHAGMPGGASVWFEWTAPATGRFSFSTRYSEFDTLVGVYTGAAPDALTEVASSDDHGMDARFPDWHAQPSFHAVEGQSYKVAVDAFDFDYGFYELHWGPAPDNDDFAAADILEGTDGDAVADVTFASAQPSEPDHDGWPAANSAWYRWTAPADGAVAIHAEAVDLAWEPHIAIYGGDSLDALTPVESTHNVPGPRFGDTAEFAARAGTTYHVAVERLGGSGGRLRVRVGSPVATNDTPESAADLGYEPRGSLRGDNFGATRDPGEPEHAGAPGGSSVWYRYTSPRDGHLSFSTESSALDTVVAVYDADDMTPVASSDDWNGDTSSYVSFAVALDDTVLVAVDSPDGAEGLFRLRFAAGQRPRHDDVSDALDVSDDPYLNYTNETATEEPGEPARHASSFGGASEWFRWTAEVSGTVTFEVDSFGALDSVVAAYERDEGGALVEVASDHGGPHEWVNDSRISFHAQEGDSVLVAVDGEWRNGDVTMGGFSLRWDQVWDDPDVVPPTVAVTTPREDDVFHDAFTISADASDDDVVDRVDFYAIRPWWAPPQLVATDDSAPYETTWRPDFDDRYEVYAVAVDRAGNSTESGHVSFVFDTTAPRVGSTAALPDVGRRVRAGGVAHEVRYRTSDELGIDHYTVERSVEGGSWRRVAVTEKPRVRQVLQEGVWYRYRVKATDTSGLTSPWSVGRASSFRIIDSKLFERGDGWRRVADEDAVGGSVLRGSEEGAVARAPLPAFSYYYAIVATKGPDYGVLGRALPHRQPTAVDLGAARTSHRKIVAAGSTHEESSLNLTVLRDDGGAAPVDVDAVVVTHVEE